MVTYYAIALEVLTERSLPENPIVSAQTIIVFKCQVQISPNELKESSIVVLGVVN